MQARWWRPWRAGSTSGRAGRARAGWCASRMPIPSAACPAWASASSASLPPAACCRTKRRPGRPRARASTRRRSTIWWPRASPIPALVRARTSHWRSKPKACGIGRMPSGSIPAPAEAGSMASRRGRGDWPAARPAWPYGPPASPGRIDASGRSSKTWYARSATSCSSARTVRGPISSQWSWTTPSKASATWCGARISPTTPHARSCCSAHSACRPRATCTRRWCWATTGRSCRSRTAQSPCRSIRRATCCMRSAPPRRYSACRQPIARACRRLLPDGSPPGAISTIRRRDPPTRRPYPRPAACRVGAGSLAPSTTPPAQELREARRPHHRRPGPGLRRTRAALPRALSRRDRRPDPALRPNGAHRARNRLRHGRGHRAHRRTDARKELPVLRSTRTRHRRAAQAHRRASTGQHPHLRARRGRRHRPHAAARIARRGSCLLSGPLAQDPAQQAPADPARLRWQAGGAPCTGRLPARCDRLAALRRTDAGRAGGRADAAQHRRRLCAEAALSAAHQVREPRPQARARRVGPGVRAHLTGSLGAARHGTPQSSQTSTIDVINAARLPRNVAAKA
ncbi:hypothetical protein VARIO8X_60623 [Burkholderiales bacterium 8X]|nr:hypothetical protein VARIO8X_60623 [Burkholderiales bacterium 8X]